jgi:hypothetical protein
MLGNTRLRGVASAALVAAFASIVVGSALAANIAGSAKNDVLRGSAQADRMNGLGGNDKLYGLAGTDTLVGGPGNDLLVGGPGRDALNCGPGRDVAVADVADRPAIGCETVSGLPRPDLSARDATGSEGNSGSTMLEVEVELAKASPLRVTVAFETRDGSAKAGSDYAAARGQLSFAPGETSKSIRIAITGDTVVEDNETLSLVLSNAVNAKLARSTAIVTITNEDVPKPRAGRYSGTTSQGRPVSFEVSPDLTFVSGLSITIDISCPSVGVVLPGERLDIPVAIVLTPDWKFSASDSYSDADGSISVRVDGGLAVNGPATGTLRLDMSLNLPFGVVNCSTGDVTWSAQPPA